MAVAFENVSESNTGTAGWGATPNPYTWTHTGRSEASGGIQGVLVFCFINNNIIGAFTNVYYGSRLLEPVSGGEAIDSLGEPGRCQAFFLGSGMKGLGGNQVVSIEHSGTADIKYAVCITVTASTAGTEVKGTPVLLQNDGTLAEVDVDTSAAEALRFGGLNSGLASVPAAGANSTLMGVNGSIDFGTRVATTVRETTGGSGSRPVGYSSGTSDDRAGVFLAIGEAVNPNVAYFGYASVPTTDGGTNFGTTVTITPPSGMQEGDLCVVHLVFRDDTAGRAFTNTVTGGQSWEWRTVTLRGWGCYSATAWCRFNGTWAANPQWTETGIGTDGIFSGFMQVFRPLYTADTWINVFNNGQWLTSDASNDLVHTSQTFPNDETIIAVVQHRDVQHTLQIRTALWFNTNANMQQLRNTSGGNYLTISNFWRYFPLSGSTGDVKNRVVTGGTPAYFGSGMYAWRRAASAPPTSFVAWLDGDL